VTDLSEPDDAEGRMAEDWRVSWVLFDLNGTLLDPAGIAEPLGGDDDARRLVGEAFHEALLLTMADTLSAGAYRPLPDYLRAALERALRARGDDVGALDAALQRAGAMDPFPDAGAALAALAGGGLHCGVLTNSATAAAERALDSAGLRDRIEVVIGSDAVQTFKPHPRVYRNAAATLDVEPAEICLVAAHAWDVTGAMRAGLRGAWAAHAERWLVPVVPEPDVCGDDLSDVAAKLVARTRTAAR
jgi:2-haloacid dehalogenase